WRGSGRGTERPLPRRRRRAPSRRSRAMAEATRVAFGRALARLGATNDRIVVLDADLASSTNTKAFADRYPERFFQLGIAEGNMVGAAAGHALVAAELLAKEGLQVAIVNVHTLKPLDATALAEWGARTGALLTVEDHGIVGGLGSAACEALSETGIPVRRHAVLEFGE